MAILAGILGKILPEVLKGVSEVIDQTTTSKEEKADLQRKAAEVVSSHLERMTALISEGERQLLADIDSARKMNVETVKSQDVLVRRFPYFLSGSIVLFGFILFGILLMGIIPSDKENIVFAILGLVGGYLTQVISYYFGSSRGSASKDETIKKMMGNTP